MCYTIGLFDGSNKTIFSFKANDEYLKLGIPILRIADFAGNSFVDKEAFVQAFLVTYPMTSQGITAASVPNLLRTMLKMCDSWEDMKEAISMSMAMASKGSITQSVLLFIEQKIPDLELPSTEYDLDGIPNVVLDFSGLNETAKSVYAELYLRWAWHRIEKSNEQPMQNIIIIDEAHRLLKSEATVFGGVARLIRSRGALWCGTQNYSDLPDYVRNQFALQLLFSTKSERDLKAIKEINALLPFAATEMRDYHFTDAAATNLHDEISIYTADLGKKKQSSVTFLKPDEKPDPPRAKKLVEKDISDKVLRLLKEEAAWPTKIAKVIAAGEGLQLHEAKFLVSKALRQLSKDGLVGKERIKVEDKEVVLYYRRDSAMSGLHRFMERVITKKLEKNRLRYKIANPGEDVPDIITDNFDIEVETGLKCDLQQVAKRMANITKTTHLIVPNELEKDRYQKIVSNPLVKISKLDEYLT